MKSITVEATAKTAYKQPIKPIKYNVTYDALESLDEVPAAEKFNDVDLLGFYNAARLANEKSKQLKIVLDAAGYVKPTLENNDLLRLESFVKVVMSAGIYTEAEAKVIAATTLKLEWPTDDEDSE